MPSLNHPSNIWGRVDTWEAGRCWNWQGAKNNRGYGQFMLNYKSTLTHRLAWQIFNGDIPNGMFICHKCDNPACMNPDHLFVGSSSDNMQDAKAKGIAWFSKTTHCPHGHEYTPENTIIRMKTAKGRQYRCRDCRECRLVYGRAWSRRRRSHGKR